MAMQAAGVQMKSPCIGICSTSLGDDTCRGCGRTLEEIRDWCGMSDEERAEIMRRLEDEDVQN